ncbi:hypothetical protein [Pelomicrobium methylotrophicum]|uniref:Uncharacterized protein n=1 Tax=Pelomicrobium methylotrophicum TaxID=2602750 RepID=A0A5C7EFZ4_9PROT|nr:hypothetical protein [Pelomicrobium methylotrophicum]TXF09890.1 hypothetical protein FR698_16440 [Pelomicrobium methylotrophicum]
MEHDKPREAQGSDLNGQERASILRFEQELKSLRGQSDTVILVFGQRLMREIFDAYVGGSPALRRALRHLLKRSWDVLRHFESGAFLEGRTEAETLEKRLIWDSLLAHDADIRDWGRTVHDRCRLAAGEGISGLAIAEILRGIANEYLPKGNVHRDVLLREAADFENRYPSFERIKRLLADSGVQIARAQDNLLFGSWFSPFKLAGRLEEYSTGGLEERRSGKIAGSAGNRRQMPWLPLFSGSWRSLRNAARKKRPCRGDDDRL